MRTGLEKARREEERKAANALESARDLIAKANNQVRGRIERAIEKARDEWDREEDTRVRAKFSCLKEWERTAREERAEQQGRYHALTHFKTILEQQYPEARAKQIRRLLNEFIAKALEKRKKMGGQRGL